MTGLSSSGGGGRKLKPFSLTYSSRPSRPPMLKAKGQLGALSHPNEKLAVAES